MTFRIDIVPGADGTTLEFQGYLDDVALDELEGRAARARAPVRLLLRTGTEVAPSVVTRLRACRMAIAAESPFLARWLSEVQS